LLLGKAYSKLGRKSEALREYAKGVKILHGTVGTELMDLLDNHPAFQIPDAFNKPNPYMAEQFYGKGLHYFWAQRYAEAEQQFNRAVAYYGQDARYQYFLGLSLLAQGGKLRRDNAAYAIEQGARLEASNRPSSTEVNAALERLQGEMRQLLNAYRTRALNAIN
jgi:tetratricopeptide (TPR) repeat protein